jgi:hypothetical protein
MDILDEYRTRAAFFILELLVERHPLKHFSIHHDQYEDPGYSLLCHVVDG